MTAKIQALPVIVLAEDERIVRLIAVEVLTDEGFTVMPAANAAEALSILETHADSVHVLFSDIHMPGQMTGLDLAHHVKRNWPWVGLLLASGHAKPAPAEMPPGARFLNKPYNPQHVVAHCRELVASQ